MLLFQNRDSKTGDWLLGIVYDENARFLGSVAGNAGVFSTLNDVSNCKDAFFGGKTNKGHLIAEFTL